MSILNLGLSSGLFAYLDPGTGSIILQVVLAVLFSGMFFLKSGWRRLCSVTRRLTGRTDAKDDE